MRILKHAGDKLAWEKEGMGNVGRAHSRLSETPWVCNHPHFQTHFL